jgi:hypothetical protein
VSAARCSPGEVVASVLEAPEADGVVNSDQRDEAIPGAWLASSIVSSCKVEARLELGLR